MPTDEYKFERLLKFEKPEDFKSRERWREDVDVRTTPPIKILGGYSFSKEMYLRCGLASCHAPHGLGFLTLLSDGTETHIGSYCGRTHLGAAWSEMEARFVQARKVEAQLDAIQGVLGRRSELIPTTRDLIERCGLAEAAIDAMATQLGRDRALDRAMETIVKLGGQLTYSRNPTEDERAINRGLRMITVRVGQMDGVAALGKSGHARSLKISVLDHLEAFDVEHLMKLKSKELDRHAKFIGSFDATIRRAQNFVRDAAKFVRPSNWSVFETYCRDSGLVRFGVNGPEIFRSLASLALHDPPWADEAKK